jgi:hypothetical protein
LFYIGYPRSSTVASAIIFGTDVIAFLIPFEQMIKVTPMFASPTNYKEILSCVLRSEADIADWVIWFLGFHLENLLLLKVNVVQKSAIERLFFLLFFETE